MVKLNVLVMWVSLVVVLSSLDSLSSLLDIVTFEILMEESIIVSIWSKLGIGKSLVVISNSWEILWSINNIWVISGPEVLIFGAVESLRWIIEVEPVGTFRSLAIEWTI